MSAGVLRWYVGARRLSATKHMGVFSSLLCDRNHPRCSFDQRLTALVGYKHASAPARIEAPVCATNDGLDNKDIAFFDQHVAIAAPTILRGKERTIVAVAAPVHEHQAF